MNIEARVISYLQNALGTDAVYAEVPEEPDAEFYVVDKTGGGMANRIASSTIAIQTYGPSKLRASEMNEDVKEAMDGFSALDEIGSCRLNSDYNFTNTAKRQHRYQSVWDITHY